MVTYLYESVAAFGHLIDFTVVRNCGLPTFRFTFGNHYAASSVAATLDGQYIKVGSFLFVWLLWLLSMGSAVL